MNLKTGVEIGVEQGLFSESLCKNNPGVKHFSIDAWKAYSGYRDHVSQAKLDGFYEATKARLAPYQCEIIRGFSLEVINQFRDGSLDYVYIDGNHNFQNLTNDISEWSKKVRVGGVISGHDYKREKKQVFNHTVQVVHGYTDAYHITPWFITSENSSRSFLWIKT